MPRLGSFTSRSLTGIGIGLATAVSVYYYPLTNTAEDPTSASWRSSHAPAGYSFIPNDGIYTNAPITNMSGMFQSFYSGTFNDPDIVLWNTSTVTNMQSMFDTTPEFNQPIGVWDVSNVTNMFAMFAFNSVFNQDIGKWDVGNVTNMDMMFAGNGVLNQNLSNWCVANIPSVPMDFVGSGLSAPNRPVWGTCLPMAWIELTDFLGGGSSNWHNGSGGPGTQLNIVTMSNNAMATKLRTAQTGDTLYVTAYGYSTPQADRTITLTSTFVEGAPDGYGYIQFQAQVAETSSGFAQLINVIRY